MSRYAVAIETYRLNLKLKNKNVLITGGSKGIGLATAKAFLREGAKVSIVARNDSNLRAAVTSLKLSTKRTPKHFVADLSKSSERKKLFKVLPSVDILINNAGAIPGGGLFSLKLKDWKSSWDLKVFGYIHLCQLYLKNMKKMKAGTIVNIIGMGGREFRSDYICGAAGNSALIAFTNALGCETSSYNVRVFGINPALTLTDRMESLLRTKARATYGDESNWTKIVVEASMPFGRITDPSEVANMVVLLSSGKASYLSGTVLDLDGGQQWK